MKLKRILSMVLCVAMVLSTMSFSVFAEDATATVSSYDELVAALANVEAEKTIELAGDITIDTSITVPDGVILDLKDNTLYVNVENSYYNNVTIKNGNIVLGKDDVHVCDGYFLVNEGKTLVLNDVNMSSATDGIKGYAVFHLKTGANLDLIDSTLNISDNEYAAGYIVYAGESTATVDITGTTVTGTNVNGIVHATTVIDNSTFTIEDAVEHGINRSAVTINDSTVTISGGTGRGITAQHGDLVISGDSVVNISDMGEATIELRGDKNLTVADTATVTVDVAVNNTTNGAITGDVTVEGATEPPVVNANVIIGEQGYATLADALEATKEMSGDIEIELFADVELSYGAREAYGKDDTTSITINGNNNTLTLNQTDSDWSSIGMANADGVFKMNNVNVVKTGYGVPGGAWNTHAINFNVNTELTNVDFDNSIKVSGTSVLTNVNIVEDEEFYGIWIPANATSVTINGGSITATNGGRGIKIADQYVEDSAQKVSLTVDGMTFETAKKAAVLVSSKGGADITTTNCDITKVAADSENFAWVDEDWSSSADKVTVNGGSAFVEGTTIINNIDELKAFRNDVNAGNTYEGKFVMLVDDINLVGENWTPIGNDSNYFMGTFDGGNNTISNMTIDIESDGNVFAGLFGGIKKATVKNLTMTNVNIDAVGAKVRAAAVVGIAYCNEVRTDATINFENITVAGCCIDATATTGSALLGGVVGYSYPANMKNINVSDLTINGKAEGNEVRVAAINGYVCGQNVSNNGNTRAPMLVDTFNVSNVTITADAYTVFAGSYAPYTYYGYITLQNGNINGLKITVDAHEAFVGGLVGYFWRSDNGHTVKNVEITGIDFDVTTDYLGETRVGGVVGTSQSPNTTYTDVAVSGKIVERCSDSANPVNYHAKVGGFVARTYEYAQQTYTNCVADVDVTGTNVVGGFVGNHNSTVSYVNCEAKGDVTGDIAGGFAGRLTEHGYTTAVTFDNCKASGNVTGTNVAGGLIGSTVNHGWAAWEAGNGTPYAKTVTLVDCEASGTVTSGTDYCAGVVGEAVMKDGVDLILDNVAHSVDPAFYPTETNVTVKTKVAQVGVEKFESLSAAITAAQPNDTIVLLANITEDITVNKSITIDGKKSDTENFSYTGNISVEGNSTSVTVKNVNFVNGTGYAITTNRIKSITVEDCTVTNYGYGFLYANKSTPTVKVKNVTVNGGNYGFHWVYGTTATLENVTMTDVTYGLYIQNYAGKTATLKNCNISSIGIWERSGSSGVQTFKFEGNNTVSTLSASQYAKYVLADDAELTAPEGSAVTASNEGYFVKYVDGTYKVEKVAEVGGNHYYSLQEAIDAANDGDIITVLADIKNVQNVTINKNIVVDLNGHTLNGAILEGSTGDITVKNGSIKNADSNYSAIEINNGKLNLTNVNIESAKHAVRIDGIVDAVIDGGTYKSAIGTGKGTYHAVNVSGGANVTIKNGEFIGPNGTSADSGAAVCVQADSKVTILGGLFTGGKNSTLSVAATGTLEVAGGIFDQDPSSYVVGGFKVKQSEKAEKFYYVMPEFNVTAVADKPAVVAGETVTITVKVTGGAFTNADWKLVFDPSKFEYTGTETVNNYTLSGTKRGSGSNNEFKDGEEVATYTFKALKQIQEVTALFDLTVAHVNNYQMASGFDNVEAETEDANVIIKMDGNISLGTIENREVFYNGQLQTGNAFVPATGYEDEVTVTYSRQGENVYRTELPAYDKVGVYTYDVKVEAKGVETLNTTATLTIKAKEVTPTVNFNVDPSVDKVVIQPVLQDVVDETYTGTVTVKIDGKELTFAASDFDFDGYNAAISTKTETITLSKGGEHTAEVIYIQGTNDNYATSQGSATVNADKISAITNDVEALKATITNAFTYDGNAHGVEVDDVPVDWTPVIPADTVTNVGEDKLVKVVFENEKYNDVEIYVVLKIDPKAVTLRADDKSKKIGEADPVFTYTVDLVNDNDLGVITLVREPGETAGTYIITPSFTPNKNYIVEPKNGKLEIGAPDYEVEVVDLKLAGVEDATMDYVAGYRMILVHTNGDQAYFKYDGMKMFDVTGAGYEYVDNDYEMGTATQRGKYKHVYGIVVKADKKYVPTEDLERQYGRDKVTFVGSNKADMPEKIDYNEDINLTLELDVNDYSMANGIYNVLYNNEKFAKSILKADYNGDKRVDSTDAMQIKDIVD